MKILTALKKLFMQKTESLQTSNLIRGILIIGAIVLFCFLLSNPVYNFIVYYLNIDITKPESFRWEYTKSIGYLVGVILLIWQITISNRRANAAEKTAEATSKNVEAALKTAEATLAANVEQRYHHAVSDLGNKNTVIRIGAIYNLYHISQNTDTYDQTIFDMFCEHLCSKSEGILIDKKEKQIIVDKLFCVSEKERVLKEIPPKVDLSNLDFNGVNFRG